MASVFQLSRCAFLLIAIKLFLTLILLVFQYTSGTISVGQSHGIRPGRSLPQRLQLAWFALYFLIIFI